MLDVVVSAEMPVPPDQVSTFPFDPRNDLHRIGGLVEVRPPPWACSRSGRALTRSVKAPFPMHVTCTIEPLGERPSVALRVRGGGGRLMQLLGPLNAWQVRRNLRADLVRLRACLSR